MAEYNPIELNISATTDDAIKNIDKLKASLKTLQKATKDLSVSDDAIKFADCMNKISKSLSTLSKVDLNTKKLENVVSQLKGFGNGLKSLDAKGLTDYTKGISSIAKTMDILSNVKLNTFGIFRKNLNNVSGILGNLDTSNAEGIKAYASSLRQLVSAVDKVGEMKSNSFQTLEDNISNLKRVMQSLDQETIDKMKEVAPAMWLLSRAKAQSAKQAVSQEENTVDTTQSISTKDLKSYANMGLNAMGQGLQSSVRAFKEMTNFANKAYTSVGKVASAIGNRLFGSLTSAIKKFNELKSAIGRIALYRALRTLIKEVTAGIQEGVENAYYWAQETGNQFASSMDQIATSANYAKNALGAMASPIFNAIAPIVDALVDKFVTLINVINQVFSLLGGSGKWIKAIKQPTTYADAIGSTGTAAKNAKKEIDLYLASFDELHVMNKSDDSSSGSGGSGTSYGDMFEYEDISSDVKKWMNMDDWTELGKIVGEKLNTITKSMDDWINKTFRPFLTTWAKRLATFLNGVMETYDFEYLGKLMADGLNALIDGANTFMKNFKSYTFGKSIGQVINGWFKNIEWDNIARYFSNKLKTFVNIAQGFVDELLPQAFENGYKIGNTLKQIFESIDWEQINKTISTGLKTIANFIEGFFSGEDGSFKDFGKELSNTLKGILENPDTTLIIEGVASCINTIIDILDDPQLWYDIGNAVGKALGAIDWNNALKVAVEAIGSAFVGLITGLFSEDHGTAFLGVVAAVGLISTAFSLGKQILVKTAIETFSSEIATKLTSTVSESVETAVAEGAMDSIGTTLSTSLSGIASSIVSALPTLGFIAIGAGIITAIGAGFTEMEQPTYQEKLKEIDELQDQFYKQFGMNETEYMQKYGATALQEAYNKLTGLDENYQSSSLSSQQSWLKDTTGTFSDLSNQTNKIVTDSYDTMKKTTSDGNSTMSSNTKVTWDDLKSSFSKSMQDLKSSLSTTWDNMKTNTSNTWSNIKTSLSNTWDNLKSNASNSFNTMKQNISNVWDNTKSVTSNTWGNIKQNVTNAWDNIRNYMSNTANNFTSTAQNTFDSVKNAITTPIENAKNKIADVVNNIKNLFNFRVSFPHIALPHFNISPRGWTAGDLLKGKIPSLSIQWYAQGGFPEDGQLFIARESGAEMVGNIGGRTAVANNDQIVAAVSQGVYSAVVSAMNGENQNNNINLTVTLDGETVYKNVVKHNNQKTKQTGKSPLMVY